MKTIYTEWENKRFHTPFLEVNRMQDKTKGIKFQRAVESMLVIITTTIKYQARKYQFTLSVIRKDPNILAHTMSV